MTDSAHTVGIWQQFEVPVRNKTSYTDPYRDVDLNVTYVSPSGEQIKFWGFYDGQATWRIRFMPDELGVWSYTATFSDGAPGARGIFTCVVSDLPGMLSRDEVNPMWFGFKRAGHGVIRSFHVGDAFFAANFPASRRQTFLDWAQAQGYNMLSIASHYLNRATPGRGQGWTTPDLWPLDAVVYQRLERLLDDLATRRMMVFPFGGFFGRDTAFPTRRDEQLAYIKYILARLGPYWNILFNVSGPEPLLEKQGASLFSEGELDRLGRLIVSLDVFDHPISIHNKTGDDTFISLAWPTYGVLQGPKTTDLAALSEGLLANHHPERPLYAQETLWSGNKFHPDYTDTQLRRNAWVLMMSAAVLNFADNGGPTPGTTGNSSSGFSGTLVLADCRQWRHDIIKGIWDFFATIPFYRMSPHQDLISCGYCLAEQGVSYLVYLPEGGTVDVAVKGGPYRITWINARNTSERHERKPTRDGVGLRPPSAAASVDSEDWLLYLSLE